MNYINEHSQMNINIDNNISWYKTFFSNILEIIWINSLNLIYFAMQFYFLARNIVLVIIL